MGYNLALLVHENALGILERDPEAFLRELKRVLKTTSPGTRNKYSILGGSVEVIGSIHADSTATIRVDGGTARVADSSGQDEDELFRLNLLARPGTQVEH